MGSNRILAFDLLKLLAIYLVLVGHGTQHLLPSNPLDEPLYIYIYSFHMPLFMMLSGYFSYSSSVSLEIGLGGGKKKVFTINNTLLDMDAYTLYNNECFG